MCKSNSCSICRARRQHYAQNLLEPHRFEPEVVSSWSDYMPTCEVQAVLALKTTRDARQLIQKNGIPFIRLESGIVVRKQDLLEYLDGQVTGVVKPAQKVSGHSQSDPRLMKPFNEPARSSRNSNWRDGGPRHGCETSGDDPSDMYYPEEASHEIDIDGYFDVDRWRDEM